MILPNSGITMSMVKSAIGSSSNNLSVLCTHANIKPWSKYKPVAFKHPCTDDYPEWWKGDDGHCGFVFNILSNFDQLKGEYANGRNWIYQTIPAEYPKRLGDYRNYNNEATAPVIKVIAPVGAVNQVGSIIPFTYQIKSSPNTGELSFVDFEGVGDGYLGIAVYKGGSLYKVATSTLTLGNGGNSVSFDGGGWQAATYQAYPFLATKNPIREGQTYPSNNYVTLPNTGELTFVVKEAAVVINPTIFMTARLVERKDEWGWTRYDVDVKFSITKLGSTEEHVFEPVVLSLYGEDGRYGGGNTWNSWTVNMNDSSTTSKEYIIEGVGDYFKSNNGTVKLSLSKKFTKETTVIRMGGGGFQPTPIG